MNEERQKTKISIVGTVGLPAAYGGFETLTENLVSYSQENNLPVSISVFCSGRKNNKADSYKGAKLIYVPIGANGASSVLYDMVSLLLSVKNRDNTILILGVSGAILIPFLRLLTKAKIITNIDGIEWKREKWNDLAKRFLRLSEALAVKYSHTVVADNNGIREHVNDLYGKPCEVIAYGGDHALVIDESAKIENIPTKYFFSLCRIEPENNVELILASAQQAPTVNLVFIGNWDSSRYGRELKNRFSSVENIYLIDPIYELGTLGAVRSKAMGYIHGHSAGGTNPSLVEIMHFGIPIIAFDCSFNRHTTHSSAIYFSARHQLVNILSNFNARSVATVAIGTTMKELAKEHYTWKAIGNAYFDQLL